MWVTLTKLNTGYQDKKGQTRQTRLDIIKYLQKEKRKEKLAGWVLGASGTRTRNFPWRTAAEESARAQVPVCQSGWMGRIGVGGFLACKKGNRPKKIHWCPGSVTTRPLKRKNPHTRRASKGEAPAEKVEEGGIRGEQGGRERWEREGRWLMPSRPSLFANGCVEWVPLILLQ